MAAELPTSLRETLLRAALVEHASLSAALAACRDAEAWVQGLATPVVLDYDAISPLVGGGWPAAPARLAAALQFAEASPPKAPAPPKTPKRAPGAASSKQKVLDALSASEWRSVAQLAEATQLTTDGIKWHLRHLVGDAVIEARGHRASRRYRLPGGAEPAPAFAIASAVQPVPRKASPPAAQDLSAGRLPGDPTPSRAVPPPEDDDDADTSRSRALQLPGAKPLLTVKKDS